MTRAEVSLPILLRMDICIVFAMGKAVREHSRTRSLVAISTYLLIYFYKHLFLMSMYPGAEWLGHTMCY